MKKKIFCIITCLLVLCTGWNPLTVNANSNNTVYNIEPKYVVRELVGAKDYTTSLPLGYIFGNVTVTATAYFNTNGTLYDYANLRVTYKKITGEGTAAYYLDSYKVDYANPSIVNDRLQVNFRITLSIKDKNNPYYSVNKTITDTFIL